MTYVWATFVLVTILHIRKISTVLGTSRTESNYQVNICPGNICPGYICPYQEYLSCYRLNFDQTLKEDAKIFVCRTGSFYPKNFTQNLLDSTKFWPQIFLDLHFFNLNFLTKTFWDLTFFDQNYFWTLASYTFTNSIKVFIVSLALVLESLMIISPEDQKTGAFRS